MDEWISPFGSGQLDVSIGGRVSAFDSVKINGRPGFDARCLDVYIRRLSHALPWMVTVGQVPFSVLGHMCRSLMADVRVPTYEDRAAAYRTEGGGSYHHQRRLRLQQCSSHANTFGGGAAVTSVADHLQKGKGPEGGEGVGGRWDKFKIYPVRCCYFKLEQIIFTPRL